MESEHVIDLQTLVEDEHKIFMHIASRNELMQFYPVIKVRYRMKPRICEVKVGAYAYGLQCICPSLADHCYAIIFPTPINLPRVMLRLKYTDMNANAVNAEQSFRIMDLSDMPNIYVSKIEFDPPLLLHHSFLTLELSGEFTLANKFNNIDVMKECGFLTPQFDISTSDQQIHMHEILKNYMHPEAKEPMIDSKVIVTVCNLGKGNEVIQFGVVRYDFRYIRGFSGCGHISEKPFEIKVDG